ncbi:MAG: glycosyltransferase [Caldilineales bacterium]
MTKRIVFLMSDTGGGHRASARALMAALTTQHGTAVHCEMVDVLTRYASWPIKRAALFYQPMVDRTLWLWRALWWSSEITPSWHLLDAGAGLWQQRRLRNFAREHPADLYVSVHPLLNSLARRAIQPVQPHARFATVVTDLDSAGRSWFDRKSDLVVVPSPAVARRAQQLGVPAARLRLLGLPIHPEFSQAEPDRAQARKALGLAERPTVLLLGGGAGIGPLEMIAQTVAPALARRDGQLVVVCGRNEALQQRLSRATWPIPVTVQGFVQDMPRWMAAADLLISKAGPGTIAEALACHLPMILSGYIPGQETGNVAYVEQNGVGKLAHTPQRIAALAETWLDPASPVLTTMQQHCGTLAHPHAAEQIAAALSELLLTDNRP